SSSLLSTLFLIRLPPPPTPTLFPYTTLFRSQHPHHRLTVAPLLVDVVRIERESEMMDVLGSEPYAFPSRPDVHARRVGTEMRTRSEEHTSELQSRFDLVCRLLLEKKKQSTTS